MNNIFLTIALILGLLLSSCSIKKQVIIEEESSVPSNVIIPTKIENTLLWEITGKGIKSPSYLFGTIHMISEKDYFMTSLIESKFAKTERLALEIDMDDPMLMFKMLKGTWMKGGKSIEDLMTPDEFKALSNYFSDSLSMSITMFKKMKPMLLSAIASEQNMQGKVVSYEKEFMKMAKEADMNVDGLESIEYQLSIFDSIPYQDQADMLLESLFNKDEDMGKQFQKMVDLYLSQDLNGLYETIKEETGGDERFEKLLLINRNKNWIPIIRKMSKEKPTFFAVGAGHLGGKVGIITLLRQAGLTLTPIME